MDPLLIWLLVILGVVIVGILLLACWTTSRIERSKTPWELGVGLCVAGIWWAWPLAFAGVAVIIADLWRSKGPPTQPPQQPPPAAPTAPDPWAWLRKR